MRFGRASDPARATSRPPRPTLTQYGSTTSPSPSASITSITSTAVPPNPPCSSANGTPSNPISANAAHTVSLHPLAESTIFARLSIEYSFAKYRFSESARSCCSSVKSKFIEQLLDERVRHAAPRRPPGARGEPRREACPVPPEQNAAGRRPGHDSLHT